MHGYKKPYFNESGAKTSMILLVIGALAAMSPKQEASADPRSNIHDLCSVDATLGTA